MGFWANSWPSVHSNSAQKLPFSLLTACYDFNCSCGIHSMGIILFPKSLLAEKSNLSNTIHSHLAPTLCLSILRRTYYRTPTQIEYTLCAFLVLSRLFYISCTNILCEIISSLLCAFRRSSGNYS